MMHPNIVGALINSALYLVCVFIAGLVTAHPLAWKFGLAAMGWAFLSHVAQLRPDIRWMPEVAVALVIASWIDGAIAGIALLF